MGLFQRSERSEQSERNGYVPLWKNPAAQSTEPAEPAGERDEPKDESLNRLQRTLIWFAAVLIAVSIFQNFQNNF